MAQELANVGAAVAAVARSEDQLTETVALIAGEGGRSIGLPVEVSDRQAVARAVADTERRLGRVDLLINKAGGGEQVGPLWEIEPDEWWRCVEVSLRAPRLGACTIEPYSSHCCCHIADRPPQKDYCVCSVRCGGSGPAGHGHVGSTSGGDR